MRVEKLVKPIGDMSDSELRDMLQQIRSDRMVTKKGAEKRKKKSKQKADKLISDINKMSPEQIAALAKVLVEEK